MSCVIIKDMPLPELSVKEALRYVGCKKEDPQLSALASTCHDILIKHMTPRVCYIVCPLTVKNDTCTVFDYPICSHHLAKHLNGCNSVMLFAATLGSDADRTIARYSSSEPSRAVMLQAVATAAIESVCDSFLNGFAKSNGLVLRTRFSPGYGDLPLEAQAAFFKLSDPKRIGLYLTDSLMLTPTKSVTAFVGIQQGQACNGTTKNKCDGCTLLCSFRS